MEEYRSLSLPLVSKRHCPVCSTPDSQEMMCETGLDFEQPGAHIQNMIPKRLELETPTIWDKCTDPHRLDPPTSQDYFGEWWDWIPKDDRPASEGTSPTMETKIPFRGEHSRQTAECSRSDQSRVSSCFPVSPTGDPQPVTYHQKNLPLPGEALTNPEPFEKEGGLRRIPASEVPFHISNMIRIEIPAKLGPHVCEHIYKGYHFHFCKEIIVTNTG